MELGGRVMEPYPLHRVALLGMGPSAVQFTNSVYYGEFRSKKGHSEIWTLNYGYEIWRHDVLFNMRDLIYENIHNPEGSFLDVYAEHPVPVLTTRFVKEIKNCYEYPWETIFKTFGDKYFSCGSSFMVAMAIMCLEAQPDGMKQLYMHGFDFNYVDKGAIEAGRANLEYWIGRATERGIDVLMGDGTTLMDCYQRKFNPKGLVGNGTIYGCQDWVPEFDESETGFLKLKGWKNGSG